MAKLIYSAITSLDGYVADTEGNFHWSTPDDEVHTFVNDLERSVGTYLYGRKLYDVMVAWETMHHGDDDLPAVMRDYTAIWQAADKVVYSSTLPEPRSRRTRIERSFDPDEVQLFVSPTVVGGGTGFLPTDLRLELELKDEYAFRNGVVYLGYRIRH
jgi:dihydrofolate reductase